MTKEQIAALLKAAEVLKEVATEPGPDSDLASLLKTLRTRANDAMWDLAASGLIEVTITLVESPTGFAKDIGYFLDGD